MASDADRPRTEQTEQVAAQASARVASDVPDMLAGTIAARYASEERERRRLRTEAAIRKASQEAR